MHFGYSGVEGFGGVWFLGESCGFNPVRAVSLNHSKMIEGLSDLTHVKGMSTQLSPKV